jgi:hypothetical protein
LFLARVKVKPNKTILRIFGGYRLIYIRHEKETMAHKWECLSVDSGGQTFAQEFLETSTPAKILAYMATVSGAGVYGVNRLTNAELAVTPPAAGADLDRKCFISAQDGDGESVRFVVPCPISGGEQTPEGERLETAEGQLICDDWGVMLGKSLTFVSGTFTEQL